MDPSHFKSPQDAWRQRCGNQTACCFRALRWRLKTFWKNCKRNICKPQSDVRPLGFFFLQKGEKLKKNPRKMWNPRSPSSWTLGLKRCHCIRCFLSLASFPKAMPLSPVCSTLRCATITMSETVASLHEQILITALHKVEPSNTDNSSQNDEE